MDSGLHLKRAENELKLAEIIFQLSKKPDIQTKVFEVADPETYYSSVINHAYYCTFYSAKAYLLKKGVEVSAPEEHRKAFEEFKRLVDNGELDVELLKIYQTAIIRAGSLLGIFQAEKKKRGEFTYRTLPQANQEPAQESIANAKIFFKNMYALCSQIKP